MRKCWICGKEATVFPDILYDGEEYEKYHDCGTWSPSMMDARKQRGYCESCFAEETSRKKHDRDEYVRLKKSLMLERAVRILERQKLDIYDYEEAIKTVAEYIIKNPQKFDSAHEIVAAIISIENETETKVGYRVAGYRIDLLLPKLFIALEIDGDRHEHSLYKDNARDIAIRNELGQKWEVVRIKTEYIEQNAELLIEAAKTIREKKQEIRKQHYGELPEWYSKREAARKPRKQKYGDELLLD